MHRIDAKPSARLQETKMTKSATLPAIRVSPRLREEAERTLRDGETLSSLVVEALERTIELRHLQREFVERGLAAAEEARAQNRYVPAATVLRRLRKQVDDARQSRSSRAARGE
jgi:hypothetical protein